MYRPTILATILATLVFAGPQPQAAAFDGDGGGTGSSVCDVGYVDVVVNVDTGDLWLHHPPTTTGQPDPELITDQVLYVGMRRDTTLRFTLTSGEANIEVSPEGGETTTLTTDDSIGRYVLPAGEAPLEYYVALDLLNSSARVPSSPRVLIRTRKTCPTGPWDDDSNGVPE